MNAVTNPSTSNTDEAQFLAPETRQQAGGVKPELGDMRAMLETALTQPGILNQAYRAFHNFSMGNQLLAAEQLLAKGLPLAPIASFNAWREKGRSVKKGEKALSLFLPVTLKRRGVAGARPRTEDDSTAEDGGTFKSFVLRARWFSLDQTEGAEFPVESVTPAWNAVTAMAALDIAEEPFQHVQGNYLGYARGRFIGLNPLNPLKHKTRIHEMAHVVLGHTTAADMEDDETPSDQLEEVEAEGVAYLLCVLLDLPGQAEGRDYIQRWLRGAGLPERNAKRIFGAADRIMKAGQSTPHEQP